MDKDYAGNGLDAEEIPDRHGPSAPPSAAPRATGSPADSDGGVNSFVATAGVEEKECRAPTTPLDPYTACASFRCGMLIDEWGEIYIRDYYWYELDRAGSEVPDYTVRAAYPKIGDDEWRQLFRRAFRRGEIVFASHRAAEAQIALEEYERPIEFKKKGETSS
jgi:hypothetical protein